MVDDLKAFVDESENGSEELAKHIENFIEVAEQKLSEQNIGEVEYRVLTVNHSGVFIYRLARQKPVGAYLGRAVGFFDYKEAQEFGKYLSKQSSLFHEADPRRNNRNFYINILIDAFGPHGERIDDWRDRLGEIQNRVEADMVGRPRARRKCLLAGIQVTEDIKLSESCWLRSPTPGEVVYEEMIDASSLMGMGTRDTGFASAILEIETVEDREAINEVRLSKTRFYTSLLRLYGCANTHTTLSIDEPITYNLHGGRSSSRNRRGSNPNYTFNAIDVERFNRLSELLEKYDQGREFSSPVSLPIEHLDDSLERRASFQDSVSFSIIGIESLYKQHTQGSTSNNDVGRFCGLVLSQVSRDMDALSVKSTINEAYGIRNTWAHGGRAGSDGNKKLQQSLWDYLRCSIIVFAWLDQQGCLSSGNLDLESALIDERQRERIKAQLEGLDIKDYLPIR